jgi:hypothetical protein
MYVCIAFFLHFVRLTHVYSPRLTQGFTQPKGGWFESRALEKTGGLDLTTGGLLDSHPQNMNLLLNSRGSSSLNQKYTKLLVVPY